ncbi:MAG: hypothetical protein CTY38_06070 [Methylotenera sp.]|uniref:hypothetical protein n=1 Tax=Methylotenera sp. TaxID=2051956 RepID=UPI000D48A31D|nr:hypothetical protein [Methylotenera sp.]PPC82617.1 MAG: hypothetical protein CTY38_06070 [Methylotenera sp.]
MTNVNSTALQTYQASVDRIIGMQSIIQQDGCDSFMDWAMKRQNVMTIGCMMDELYDAAQAVKVEVGHA